MTEPKLPRAFFVPDARRAATPASSRRLELERAAVQRHGRTPCRWS